MQKKNSTGTVPGEATVNITPKPATQPGQAPAVEITVAQPGVQPKKIVVRTPPVAKAAAKPTRPRRAPPSSPPAQAAPPPAPRSPAQSSEASTSQPEVKSPAQMGKEVAQKISPYRAWIQLGLRIIIGGLLVADGIGKFTYWTSAPFDISTGTLYLYRAMAIIEPLVGLAIIFGFFKKLTPFILIAAAAVLLLFNLHLLVEFLVVAGVICFIFGGQDCPLVRLLGR